MRQLYIRTNGPTSSLDKIDRCFNGVKTYPSVAESGVEVKESDAAAVVGSSSIVVDWDEEDGPAVVPWSPPLPPPFLFLL